MCSSSSLPLFSLLSSSFSFLSIHRYLKMAHYQVRFKTLLLIFFPSSSLHKHLFWNLNTLYTAHIPSFQVLLSCQDDLLHISFSFAFSLFYGYHTVIPLTHKHITHTHTHTQISLLPVHYVARIRADTSPTAYCCLLLWFCGMVQQIYSNLSDQRHRTTLLLSYSNPS